MDFSQFDPIRARQEQFVYFCASHDRNMRCVGERQRFFDIVNDFSTVFGPIRGTCQNDMATAGEQARQALKRLAPHDHRRTGRQLLEATKIGGQVPGQRAIFSDHAIIGAGHDEDNLGSVHTATGAEM